MYVLVSSWQFHPCLGLFMCLLGHDVALGRRLTFEDLIPQILMIPRPGATTIY